MDTEMTDSDKDKMIAKWLGAQTRDIRHCMGYPWGNKPACENMISHAPHDFLCALVHDYTEPANFMRLLKACAASGCEVFINTSIFKDVDIIWTVALNPGAETYESYAYSPEFALRDAAAAMLEAREKSNG